MQAMTGRMQALAQELVVARERAGLAATPPPTAPGGAQQQVGSVPCCTCCRRVMLFHL